MPTNKQRREASRRHLERQLQRRQEQEAASKRRTLIATVAGTLVLVLIVVVVIVMATNDNKSTPAAAAGTPSGSAPASGSAAASASTAPAAKYPCAFKPVTPTPGTKKVSLPMTTPPKTGTAVVDVATTAGPMVLTLNRAEAPCTVASFTSLTKQQFYNNTPCHRLVTSNIFVLQCGDPTGKGTGGPGYTIGDEFKGTEKYTRGVLAMANTGQPNTGGSQFFIVYKDSPLPAQYTVFGTVTSGLQVVDTIAKAGSNNANGQGDGAPKKPITLTTLTVK